MAWDFIRDVFGWGSKWGRRPEKTEKTIREKPKGMITTCPSCGFRGDETKFLTLDSEDTTCPKCKEDVSVYEI